MNTTKKTKKTIPTALKIEGRAIWERLQLAKSKASRLRIIVDTFKTELLAREIFLNRYDGQRILEPKSDWCMGETAFRRYWKIVEDEMTSRGLREGLEAGHCPALVAENEVTQINRQVIDWTAKVIGEGKEFIDGIYSNMDYYNEALSLFDRLHR